MGLSASTERGSDRNSGTIAFEPYTTCSCFGSGETSDCFFRPSKCAMDG